MATYQIKPGDSLSKIAQQFGYGGDYMSIARANNIQNPNLIRAGATLNIPDRSAPGQAPASAPAPVQQPVQQPQQQVQSGGGAPPVDMSKYAGWNDQAAIQADWNNNWRSKSGQSGGGTPSFSMPSAPQAPNFQNIYDTYLKQANDTYSPQISAAQQEADLVQQEINDKTAKFNTAMGKLNDNPYYSEATRLGRAAKLKAAYESDVALSQNKLSLANQKLTNTQNQAEKAKADAMVRVNIASNQYNIENQQYQQQLQQINSYLSAGMFDNASGADIAQIATSTGMSTSMVQSIIDASKKSKEVKPELQTADDGTNQYVVAIDPMTGNVINKQIISSSKPKATGTSSDDKQEKAFDSAIADGIQQLQRGEDWGTVWQRIKTKFPDVPDALIDASLGISWREGGAYEKYKGKRKASSEPNYNDIIPEG